MAEPSPDSLREALRDVADLATGRDIVSAGLIDAVQVRGGLVQVTLRTDRQRAPQMEPLRRAVEARLAREPGVSNATAILTAHRPAAADPAAPAAAAPHKAPAPPGAPASPGAPAPPGAAAPPGAPAPPGAAAPPGARRLLLENVGAVIAVASGKGGVGKSTVAVNLAVTLAASGRRVGLLDADIYGPSLPRMLGVAARPELRGERMVPLGAWGLRAMSIGFLVDEDTAMIWRGPMVMSALEQMMGQVDWGQLDVMVVDMPPGTGDVALTMAQRVAVTGAVIVSTPQDIALLDARRGVRMFEKTHVPVLGLIENMSYFACPNCGARSHLFGHGGARAEAARLGVPFLGEVPLLLDIRESGDAGTPIVAAAPGGDAARAFGGVAEALLEQLRVGAGAGPGPVITVE